MAKVNDVAAYILEHAGPLTAMKLQKLVYYSQAWQLVWEDKALFPERIEAMFNYYSQVDRSEDAKDLKDWELEPFDCEPILSSLI